MRRRSCVHSGANVSFLGTTTPRTRAQALT